MDEQNLNSKEKKNSDEVIEQIVNCSMTNIDVKYKLSLYIILKQCIEEVGLNKEKLIKRLKEMQKFDEIDKLTKKTIINKQFMKQFLAIDEKHRQDILEMVVYNLEKLKAENGIIKVSNNIPIKNKAKDDKKTETKKLKEYKGTDQNIVFNLSPEYSQNNIERANFYANYSDELDICAYIYRFNEHFEYIEDGEEETKRTREYKEEYNNKILKSHINYLDKIVDNFKLLNEKKVENIEKKVFVTKNVLRRIL